MDTLHTPKGHDGSKITPSGYVLRFTFYAVCVLLLAFFLRVIGLNTIPPGWRDDEVIETTVHAQFVLDGERPLYFIQAEGHEPLYHYLTAGWIALAGRSLFSVRLVSVFFGLLTVAATYRFTRQLFGPRAGLLAALLLAVSFWALMYSRIKIRHTAELPFALLAFSHLWKIIGNQRPIIGAKSDQPSPAVKRSSHLSFVLRRSSFVIRHSSFIVLFLTLALYSYLAATTLLFIIPAFLLYCLMTFYVLRLAHSQYRNLRYAFISLALAAFLYLPLANAIRSNAQRLNVVGGPLNALRNGEIQPLIQSTVGALAMFGNTGDNEALYNIPGRPIFNIIGFYFFLGGVLLSLWRWRDPRYALLLIWLVGGLMPGFVSNPPGSLGHTITALPVTYILAVLPIIYFSPQRTQSAQRNSKKLSVFSVVNILGACLFASIALQDLPDYFWHWPALPEVRYLYRADLHAKAKTLRGEPPATYVLSGSLSKWDRVAFTLEGVKFSSPPRWVNAEWATIFPAQDNLLLYSPAPWQLYSPPPDHPESIHFSNDLIFEGWRQQEREVYTYWQVGPAYTAAESDMGPSVASPPFPAFIFLHLLDANGALVAGSDRFDADAFTLQPGDRYWQRHTFDAPAGSYTLEIGLYDPTTGERYLTAEGRDAVMLGAVILP